MKNIENDRYVSIDNGKVGENWTCDDNLNCVYRHWHLSRLTSVEAREAQPKGFQIPSTPTPPANGAEIGGTMDGSLLGAGADHLFLRKNGKSSKHEKIRLIFDDGTILGLKVNKDEFYELRVAIKAAMTAKASGKKAAENVITYVKLSKCQMEEILDSRKSDASESPAPFSPFLTAACFMGAAIFGGIGYEAESIWISVCLYLLSGLFGLVGIASVAVVFMPFFATLEGVDHLLRNDGESQAWKEANA